MLVTTLTKRMAEDLTDYLIESGLQGPLPPLGDRHARAGRDPARACGWASSTCSSASTCCAKGLDLPEVSLVAILDADKEGFLRGETRLIQTIGRAARNVNGRVIMYADRMTDSMQHGHRARPNRRRAMQVEVQRGARHHAADHRQGRVSDIAQLSSASPIPSKRGRARTPAERYAMPTAGPARS